MQQKSMRILYACEDEEVIWVIDEVIYGLYAIDKRTFHTKCVVDSATLFRYGKFKPHRLVKWKENCLVIIPFELHKKWVIFHKISGRIEYRQVTEEKGSYSLIGICGMEKQAYFCPYNAKDPIVVVDFNKMICNRIIRNWNSNISLDNTKVVWKGAYNDRYIFFPLRDTQTLIRINQKNQGIKLIELNIPETIADIDGSSEELWILPMKGEKVYQINEEGTILDSIKLEKDGRCISAPEFVRIVVQKNYLFLLPYRFNGIWVYEKSKKCIHVIGETNDILSETYKTLNFRYYGYYFEGKKIGFLPWQNKCTLVDLNSLSCEQKDIFYPIAWSEDEYKFWYNWNLSLKYDFLFQEEGNSSFESFLEYLKREKRELFSKYLESVGKRIWLEV